MYETRLPGSGGRAKGLTGLGGPSRGPVDVLLNGLVGLLLAYLLFTLVEPFWVGAIESTREVALDTDRKTLVEAFRRYELRQGAYRDTDLRGLEKFLSNVPVDPWGRPYVVDPFFRRVISGGEDRAVGKGPEDPASLDDRTFYYRPPWKLLVVLEDPAGDRVPYEVRMDGTRRVPVAGRFLAGPFELARSPDGTRLAYSATGQDGSADLAARIRVGGDDSWIVTGPGDARSPTFHPDGTMIYFSEARHAPSPTVYRVGLDGNEPQPVTEKPDGFDHPDWDGDVQPDVDPNSGHVVFVSAREVQRPERRICFVPRGEPGQRVRVLPDMFPPGTHPRWSPDGKSVRYLEAGGRSLVTVPFPPRPGKVERIPLPVAAEGWLLDADAEQLALASHRGGEAILTIVPVRGGEGRPVLRAPGRIVSLNRIE